MRWWPAGEQYEDGYFHYPLSESPENMPEPFRSILEEEVAEERGKLLRIEAPFADLHANSSIQMPLSDQDLLTGEEIDVFLRAENGKREEKESAEACRRLLGVLPTPGREVTHLNRRNPLNLSGI